MNRFASQLFRAVIVLCLLLPTALSQAVPSAPRPPSLRDLDDGFGALARRVSPAVVRIYASGFGLASKARSEDGAALETRRREGSGVLVHSDGFIVTNAHLIAGAQRVRVLLISPGEGQPRSDGSIIRPPGRLLEGRILGLDLETDLAVIKIDVRVLRFLRFADSDSVRKGHFSFAFGSSAGVNDSMSLGVVSSIARQLRFEDPMIYIQTDAAMRADNDGGPLTNTSGDLIGLCNFEATRRANEPGYGFAAPSNVVKAVYEQIRENGVVQRGSIGLIGQTINPVLAEALELSQSWGVLVADVFPGSPAEAAGIRIGDIVGSLEGKTMENARQLDVNLYRYRVGDSVKLSLKRGGEELEVTSKVIERPDDLAGLAGMIDMERSRVDRLGVLALELNERVARLVPGLRRSAGVIVASNTAAGTNPTLRTGDVIHAVNGSRVRNLEQLHSQLAPRQLGEIVALQIERDGSFRYILVEVL